MRSAVILFVVGFAIAAQVREILKLFFIECVCNIFELSVDIC